MTPFRRIRARSCHMIETVVQPMVARNPMAISYSRYSGPADRNATLVSIRMVETHFRYQSIPPVVRFPSVIP